VFLIAGDKPRLAVEVGGGEKPSWRALATRAFTAHDPHSKKAIVFLEHYPSLKF
jgi:hypothetical protein